MMQYRPYTTQYFLVCATYFKIFEFTQYSVQPILDLQYNPYTVNTIVQYLNCAIYSAIILIVYGQLYFLYLLLSLVVCS